MTSSLSRSSQGLVAVDRSEAREDFHPGPDYFSRSGESFGRDSIDLIIGPIRMRLLGLAGDQAEALGERFRPFTAEGRGKPDLSITLRPAGVPGFLTMRRQVRSETYRLESRVDGGGAHLWSYEFAGRLEPAAGRAMLDLVEPQGALFDRGLENFLRVMTASFILSRGGFLLHGSGVVREGRAYVFFGPSGAGKTTITTLSPADTILSDDLTLVVRREDGGYGAAGIPFGLAHHRVPEARGSYPIASMNRLVQSRRVRREPIRGAQAVAEVASSLPFVMQETRQSAQAIDNVGRALRSVPVFRLEFRKDASFWDLVEES